MGQPYVGEIRMFAGSFAPAGWAFCDGSLHPISENETLFQLIGTTYGGDGESTFGYPNLQGRVPMHMGQGPGISRNYPLSEASGGEQVTLNTQQIPVHSHPLLASAGPGNQASAQNNLIAGSTSVQIYIEDVTDSNFNAQAAGSSGGSQPHDNMQPYLTVSFIISLFGIFPTQT